MNVRELLEDDVAVSPVIGVILMVAITVILAAVIGTFVLGLGDQVSSSAPQASFSFEFDNDVSAPGGTYDNLTISHDGGDSIPAGQLSASASTNIGWAGGASNYAGPDSNSSNTFQDMGLSGDVSAGDSVVVANEASDGQLNDQTVRVVWAASSGDSTATLAKWEGPNA